MPEHLSVTVAVCVYNGERYIAPLLDSCQAQSRPPDELLVIDDGSTDRTVQAVRERGAAVRLICHQTNRGLAEGRNTAIREAQGAILIFVDADTVLDRECVARLLHSFVPGIAGVAGRGVEAGGEGLADRWRRLHAEQSFAGLPQGADCDFCFGLCAAYRREALLAAGGFDAYYRTNAEDMDLGFRLRDSGYRLCYQPEAVVYHQRRDTTRTLRAMLFRWYYWGLAAWTRNRRLPVRGYFQGLRRDLVTALAADRHEQQGLALAALTVYLHAIKVWAFVLFFCHHALLGRHRRRQFCGAPSLVAERGSAAGARGVDREPA